MNYALIIAGGSGNRMGQDIPKQFINVYDKPVLIYTLESFQRHPMVDAIVVVCLNGWHDVLRAYANQFNITKLQDVVSGGKSTPTRLPPASISPVRRCVVSLPHRLISSDVSTLPIMRLSRRVSVFTVLPTPIR